MRYKQLKKQGRTETGASLFLLFVGGVSMERCRGGACPSRRPTGDTNRLSTKTYQPIASVAALSERLWQLQISVHYVDRTCLVGGGVLDATLRNATIFAGSLPVIRPCTARLPRAQSALAMTNLFALRH